MHKRWMPGPSREPGDKVRLDQRLNKPWDLKTLTLIRLVGKPSRLCGFRVYVNAGFNVHNLGMALVRLSEAGDL